MTGEEKDLIATIEMLRKENLKLEILLVKAEERIVILEKRLALRGIMVPE